ncbi:MAG: META domain-containing protein [Burkholderiales bacterium]
MRSRSLLAVVAALAVAGCALRDPDLAPGSGAPSYTPSAPPPALSVAADQLVGPVWHWQGTRLPDGRMLAANGPERYTLTFQGGGRVLLRADCNRGSGAYEVNGGAMRMGPAAMTRVGCPPDSQDNVFASALARVASYAIAGGELTLTLVDGGVMTFRKGAP